MSEVKPDEPQEPPAGKKWCKACHSAIDKPAKLCKDCNSWQKIHFTSSATVLSLLTALFAVLSTYIPVAYRMFHRHSETSFKVTRADASHLYVKVWNTGPKPSLLLGYRLRFPPARPATEAIPLLPIRAVDLDLAKPDEGAKNADTAGNIIEHDAAVEIVLTTNADLVMFKPGRPGSYRKEQVTSLLSKPLVKTQSSTLEIDVEESNDPSDSNWWSWNRPRQFHIRSHTFPVDRVSTFIVGRMSDEQ